MNKKIILPVSLILILSFALIVSARMTFITEDDGIYNIYKSEIILEKGWNLVSFGGELDADSEIKEGDIKAIFYYNPSTKTYVQYYPESDEFNNLMNQNSCGDQSCNPEERESYSNWCYKDCKTELNDDIISHLNVISEKTFTLSKNEKKTLDFAKYYDMEIYWNQNSMSGSCSERGYSNVDCVMLHHDITSRGLNNDNEFINSPNDGNPYNDRFGVAYPIGTYTDQESVIYAKVDYTSESGKYKFTFYEIDDDRVKTGYDGLPIPSVGAKIMSQPAWVYSNKRGLLKTEDMSIKLEQINLNAGWNFIKVTPEFTGSLNQMKGNCNVQKAYLFDAENQEWGTISNLMDDDRFLQEASAQGQGMILKVANNCNMAPINGGNGGINPPTIPN